MKQETQQLNPPYPTTPGGFTIQDAFHLLAIRVQPTTGISTLETSKCS